MIYTMRQLCPNTGRLCCIVVWIQNVGYRQLLPGGIYLEHDPSTGAAVSGNSRLDCVKFDVVQKIVFFRPENKMCAYVVK